MRISACELVVVGVGGVGSAAFYAAARSGIDVLALDPHPAGHDRGSSHGQSRMIRGAYFEHPDYVPLVLESFTRWEELERISGRTLLHPTGVLEVGDPDGPIIQGILASARQHNLPLEELTPVLAAKRFPQFAVGDRQVALFEQRAGLLRVEACVETHIAGAVAAGGRFESGTPVAAIEPVAGGYRIESSRGSIRCERVVVAGGAWSGDLLPFLRPYLQVRRKHQYWFAIQDPRYRLDQGSPAFYFATSFGHFYGFPAIERDCIKIAQHSGGEPVVDPTHVDRGLDRDDLLVVQKFAAEHLAGRPEALVDHSVCMYTMSPDEHFIVDRHPEWPGVAFVAGLSGHGFKFAPVLGDLLVRITAGERDSRLDFLRLARFA